MANNKSRSQRLLESMRITAPGVTHRSTGTSSNIGATGGLYAGLATILRKLNLLPAVPPPLNISGNDYDPTAIPLSPPGPRGPAGATGAIGPAGKGGGGGPQTLVEDTSLMIPITPHFEMPQSLRKNSIPTFAGFVCSASTHVANFLNTATSGLYRYFRADTNGLPRFGLILANNTAESGSDAGSDFQLFAYNDIGNLIDIPVTIFRVAGGHIVSLRPVDITGDVAITGNLAVSGVVTGTTSPWVLVMNEAGTSLTNWTQFVGSWSVVSSAFHVAAAALGYGNLLFSTGLAQSAMVFQADVKMESGGGYAADNRVGLLFNASNATGGSFVTLRSGGALTPSSTGKLYIEQPAGVTPGPSINRNFNLDQFYTLRIVAIGPTMDVYIDGVYVNTFAHKVLTDAMTTQVHTSVVLYVYNCKASFKNIKMWTMTLP